MSDLPVRPPRDPGEAGEQAFVLAREAGLSITAADLLHRKGHVAGEALARFLNPRLADLTPPDAMADRDACAERIVKAIEARERIAIFGDYDCDGITATAILTTILRALGAEVEPLLAIRDQGGYGLSTPALGRVRETGASLLITCDCGSSDHERLAAAKAAGLDVIVIDHHLVPAEPLPALAFLNPHRPECGFAFKGLASCGLALSIGAAVRKRIGIAFDLRPLLDLVAIGTIADVAPLDGDNRVLVRAGLAALAQNPRPGLRALAEYAKLDLSRPLTGEDIAFRVAPRLNAAGRLGDPKLALALLLAETPEEAQPLADALEQVQTDRRQIQERILAEATSQIERGGLADAPAIVLAHEGWHAGVVGIVAGRIASEYGKPTIVVGLDGETGRGSVRGPQGFRLHDALSACKSELVGFGGHQAAAGVEVQASRVEALREAFCRACAAQGSADFAPAGLVATVRLDPRDEPTVVVRDLARVEPCGEGNPAPLLLLPNAQVRSARDLKGHLKLDLSYGGRSLPGFAFQLGAQAATLKGKRVDVIGRLRWDTYRGGDAVELRVESVTPVG